MYIIFNCIYTVQQLVLKYKFSDGITQRLERGMGSMKIQWLKKLRRNLRLWRTYWWFPCFWTLTHKNTTHYLPPLATNHLDITS